MSSIITPLEFRLEMPLENPISVYPALAMTFGLNEAIVLQQLHYWLVINQKANKNYKEGKYWCFNSMQDWHENNFPFWSIDTIKRTFTNLRTIGLIETGNFNKTKFDKTVWYTLNYPMFIDKCKLHQSEIAICPNGEEQIAPMEDSKMTKPIPETTQRLTETTATTANLNKIQKEKIADNSESSIATLPDFSNQEKIVDNFSSTKNEIVSHSDFSDIESKMKAKNYSDSEIQSQIDKCTSYIIKNEIVVPPIEMWRKFEKQMKHKSYSPSSSQSYTKTYSSPTPTSFEESKKEKDNRLADVRPYFRHYDSASEYFLAWKKYQRLDYALRTSSPEFNVAMLTLWGYNDLEEVKEQYTDFINQYQH
jgi:hypothetical protein